MTAKLYDEMKLRTNEMKWIEFSPGIDYKILRTSPETGAWTVLFRCAKGSSFPPHLHYGAGEYFMFKGVMDYRMGIATAGDYGYGRLACTTSTPTSSRTPSCTSPTTARSRSSTRTRA
jgi:hypothetical protein